MTGIKPLNIGRPRKYLTDAERQRAWYYRQIDKQQDS